MLDPSDRHSRDSKLIQFTTKRLKDFIDPNHPLTRTSKLPHLKVFDNIQVIVAYQVDSMSLAPSMDQWSIAPYHFHSRMPSSTGEGSELRRRWPSCGLLAARTSESTRCDENAAQAGEQANGYELYLVSRDTA